MNTPYFIAKRLIQSERSSIELSKPIVRIATIGIALGMAVMIISIGIVTGFQREIREKVIGFGSHIQITSFSTSRKVSDPKLEINQDFYPYLDTVQGVKHINIYALKEGVIETDDNIQGILAKGVSTDYNWDFLSSKLNSGKVLQLSDSSESNGLLLSQYLAGRLDLIVGDKVPIYFQNARGAMSQRNFRIVGIFDSGLQEMDEEFVFVDIAQIRKLNQWGLNAQLLLQKCKGDSIVLFAQGYGGADEILLNWSVDSLSGSGPFTFCASANKEIYVVASDRSQTKRDTAFFKIADRPHISCFCPDSGESYISTSGGSGKYYTGGFEVQLNSYQDLDHMDEIIYEYLNYDLKTSTIKQHLPEIFNWLEMLDLNTFIIIGLMILISIVNMTSALLILIMERTNMIGMLKALGAGSWLIQKIFLTQAAYIISIGLLVGNAVGIGLCVLQKQFGVLELDPQHYYVSLVPMLLDPVAILVLNVATLLICLTALLIPSLAVAQISPTKAIRFD